MKYIALAIAMAIFGLIVGKFILWINDNDRNAAPFVAATKHSEDLNNGFNDDDYNDDRNNNNSNNNYNNNNKINSMKKTSLI